MTAHGHMATLEGNLIGLKQQKIGQMISEKLIEKKLKNEVEKMGGLAIKFASSFYTGMPDRIVLMPGEKISFVETKSEGKKTTPRQNVVIGILRSLGFRVDIIDNLETLEKYVKSIKP